MPPIWETLHRVQVTLNLGADAFADLMQLTPPQFLRMKGRRQEPGVQSILALCNSLNMSLETFITGDIDFVAMVEQFHGNAAYIPEKYSVSANSHRRTVVNLLNYMETNLGWEKRAQVLRRHQMTEAMFTDPDALINLRFSVDISSWILKHYRDPKILFDMGRNAAVTYWNSPIRQRLAVARNLKELFELMFDSVAETYVEKNFKWQLASINAETLTLRGTPDPELVAKLGVSYMHNLQGCLIRQGFISSIPAYLGYPSAPVTKSACVCAGHDYCEFQVDLRPVIRTGKGNAHSQLVLC